MKEATGELSTTAIAVVAIAAIGVVFSQLIWPQIKSTINRSTLCTQAFNCTECNGETCKCSYYEEDGSVSKTKVECADQSGKNGTGTAAPATGGLIKYNK